MRPHTRKKAHFTTDKKNERNKMDVNPVQNTKKKEKFSQKITTSTTRVNDNYIATVHK